MGDPSYASEAHRRDGPLAGGRRGGHERRARCAEKIVADRPGRHPGPLLAGRRRRAGRRSRASARSASSSRSRPATARRARWPARAIATDTNKCQLKPLRRSRLLPDRRSPTTSGRSSQAAFPTGVCDWSKPGRRPAGRDPVADLPGRATARSSTAARRSARRPAPRCSPRRPAMRRTRRTRRIRPVRRIRPAGTCRAATCPTPRPRRRPGPR